MNATVFSEQISRTGNLVGNLKLRQNKLKLMARFMDIKSINPKKETKCNSKKIRLFKFYLTTLETR